MCEGYYNHTSNNSYNAAIPIVKNGSDYDSYKGLKSESRYYLNSSGSWSLDRTEDFEYDSDLDYLTSANYGSGATTWSYDPSGNRSNSGYTYDNLNRMTASPGSYTYENDVLGNRTWRNHYASTGGQKYEWDELNRMTKFMSTTSGARYEYRADGTRVQKVEGFNLLWQWNDKAHTSGYYDEHQDTNLPTTRYYYDGQMGIEDDYTAPSTNTIRKYGIGSRGIDYLENWSNSTTIASKLFPLYDCHGNMIATLERSGSNSYTMANTRYFDAWGTPSNSSGPHQKYCANLGHVQDDESGLIYMRARYYEPGSGRFVSEDPARDSLNWFTYARNVPTVASDPKGKATFFDIMGAAKDEIEEKIGELKMGVQAMNRMLSTLERACCEWAERMGVLDSEEWASMFGEEGDMMGIEGQGRIHFHVLGDSAHMTPHIQLDWIAQSGERVREWLFFDSNGVGGFVDGPPGWIP